MPVPRARSTPLSPTFDDARVGALLVSSDPFYTSRRQQIVRAGGARRHPCDVLQPRICHGWRADELWQRHSRRISEGRGLCRAESNGAKPADLPVDQATKFEFVINLKTAKTLGMRCRPASLQAPTR